MKKFVKAILAVSTCMPLLAFSACNGLPEVSDAEKPAVFANYSEKYAAALETAAQGDLYLNQYFSVRMQAVNGDTKLDATVLGEANYDIVGGELTRQTSEMTEKITTVDGETEESGEMTVKSYFTEEGAYMFMSQTVGDETKEQKQFQAANPDDSQTVDIASVLEFIPFSATYDEVAAEFSDLKMYASDNGTMFKIEFSADLTNASDDYAGEIISVLGEENIEMELTQSYTLRMDTSGNLISTEMELIAKFYEVAPETDNSENGGDENGEVAPVSDMSETPPAAGDGSTEEGGEEENAPVSVKREGLLRISFKTTVKDASSVKLPTKAELDTYKKPETTEEPSEGGEETPAA